MKQAELKTRDSLLQAVATITGQRDLERLECALLSTFLEIFPSGHISLFQLLQGEQGDEIQLKCEGEKGVVNVNTSHVNAMPIAIQSEFRGVMESGREIVRPVQDKNTFVSVFPISGSHGIGGFLHMVSARPGETELRIIHALLKIYGNYLGILLESETDTLTGLLNRRTFDQNIIKIIAERTAPDQPEPAGGRPVRARRKGGTEESHWLALMDIDHFKKVNDQYGHIYGDEVLIMMARSMSKVFRRKDKLFRFGGEEFVVVLDRTSLANARDVLERFRKTMEGHEFPQIGRVTVSIGFVRLAKAEVPSAIIGHADQALYYAKHTGRNRVCQYEELLANGKLSGIRYSEDMQIF